MKIALYTLTATFGFGAIFFGRWLWIAGQQTSTAYLAEFFLYGAATIICILIAIGFGIWAILS